MAVDYNVGWGRKVRQGRMWLDKAGRGRIQCTMAVENNVGWGRQR